MKFDEKEYATRRKAGIRGQRYESTAQWRFPTTADFITDKLPTQKNLNKRTRRARRFLKREGVVS